MTPPPNLGGPPVGSRGFGSDPKVGPEALSDIGKEEPDLIGVFGYAPNLGPTLGSNLESLDTRLQRFLYGYGKKPCLSYNHYYG